MDSINQSTGWFKRRTAK